MKIKIFVGAADEVTQDVNVWLSVANPVVREMTQSEVVSEGFWGLTLTFLYEER